MQISGEYRDGGYQEYTSHVKCESCGSISEVVTESLSLSEVEKMAEEAWNTRVERTCRATSCRDYPDWGSVAYTCSECGEILVCFDFEQDPPKPIGYCPNCGAKVVEK